MKKQELYERINDIGEWIYNVSGVDDTGIGKDGEKQEHILEMYKTLDELHRRI